jgi:hypothetical protein
MRGVAECSCKDLHVADHADATPDRVCDRGIASVDAGADRDLVHSVERGRIKRTIRERDVRMLCRERLRMGGRLPVIRHPDRRAVTREPARHRKTRLAEPEHQHAFSVPIH